VASAVRGIAPVLVEEGVRGMIVKLAEIAAQLIFLYIAYAFGKSQGRAQLRHERAAEAIVAALRIIRKLSGEFGMWALRGQRDDLEIGYAKEISRLRRELQSLVYDNSPWFEPETEGKLNPVLKEVGSYYGKHTDALKSGDAARIKESGKQLSEWRLRRLTLLEIALEDEARRLIGTKRHWRSTRRGRLLAWFQRNPGWLMGVLLPVLGVVLVSVVVYLLVTG
jgi:hypothetical protein